MQLGCVAPAAMTSRSATSLSRRGGITHCAVPHVWMAPLWRDTFLGVAAHALAAVSLGIARAAIDEFTGLAASKTPNASSTPLRDRPTIQAKLAQAEALVRSARAFFYETLEDVWQTACEGDSPSPNSPR